MDDSGFEALPGRPIVYGEVLFDRFPEGSTVLGGAPFNVAWHLRGFGLDPLFISRVGTDAPGDEILERMHAWEMATGGLQRDPGRPTGSVDVEIRAGQPSYHIAPHQAYDRIASRPALDALRDVHGSLLYSGTLIRRSAVSRKTLQTVRRTSRLPLFVDLNLRRPWWSARLVADAVDEACWLKLNRDEFCSLLRRTVPCGEIPRAGGSLLRDRDLQMLVVTLGARGAVLAHASGSLQGRPLPVDDLADTVGAGDGFSAVTILGICRGWSHRKTLDRAQEFAAQICRQRGALPRDRSLYQTVLDEWQP